MTFRDEPDLDTTWTWGTSATDHNRGQLQGLTSVATPGNLTYQEVIAYDAKARLSERTITLPGDATQYKYNLSYDDVKTGSISTQTYPTSTSGYRLSLKYETTDGILTTLRDNNAQSIVFWSLGSVNALAFPTQETFGGTILRTSAYDAVNGLLSTLTTGTSANPAALQNLSFGYDALGNLNQRQNVNRFLTENFYYGSATDNLNRLDHTTLSVNNQAASTNFDADYDQLGNFQQKTDNSGTDVPVNHTVEWTSFNVPSSITASAISESATFDYGPNHERWRMTFTKSGQVETTNYIGEVTEKVTVGAVTEYRQYIMVNGRAIAISSRKTSGVNTVVYLLGDHQLSLETVANSSGATIVNESFTPYGTRRDAIDWSGPPDATARATMDGTTRLGYTSHTVLGSMGLNHMRGRVQDAIAGVFLSPDPLVTDPQYSQHFNRYAYVSNNPGTLTDSSGFTEDRGPGPWLPTVGPRDLPCSGSDSAGIGLGIGWSREERDLWGSLFNGTVSSIPGPNIDDCMNWDEAGSVTPAPKLGPYDPKNASDLHGGGHEYGAFNKMCDRPLTEDEQRDLIRRFTVPSSYTTGSIQSENGDINMVANWFGWPGGFVTTTYSPDGLVGTNVTTPIHIFKGTVERSILNTEHGSYMQTHGTGGYGSLNLPAPSPSASMATGAGPAIDIGWALDFLNQKWGPGIFNDVDEQAALYAKWHFPGCH
jgi:RHS repeat-associated protein